MPSTDAAPPRKYQKVADSISGLIDAGTLKAGDRVPSIRSLSTRMSVSVSTVLEAYRLLEDARYIEARPKSGYYVRCCPGTQPRPARSTTCAKAASYEIRDLVLSVIATGHRPDIVPLGAAVPSAEYLPTAQLSRLLSKVVRENPDASQSYGTVQGEERLRAQIAKRLIDAGCTVSPEDVQITSGAQEAVTLGLRAVTQPGDTVIVESPTYYGLLEALALLDLRVLEVATDPVEGICLQDLGKALAEHDVAACVLSPNFGNPLGHCMSVDNKRALVAMLAEANVPLVEDDIYGELGFDGARPPAAKSFDAKGLVMHCSSFSKTLAPGYRIGWIVPGRWKDRVARLKFSSSVATATPTQLAVAAFLESGGFDRHLRRLRRTYQDLLHRVTGAVVESFPEGVPLTQPAGGHVLWVELPKTVNSLELHEDALKAGLSIAPGVMFSTTKRYDHFIRLNCAVPWTPRVESAIHALGRLVAEHV